METTALGSEGPEEGFGRRRDMVTLSGQDEVQAATLLLLGLKQYALKTEDEDFFSAAGSVETTADEQFPLVPKMETESVGNEMEESEFVEDASYGLQKRNSTCNSSSSKKKQRRGYSDGTSTTRRKSKSSSSKDYSETGLEPDTNVACKVRDAESGDSQWILGRLLQYFPESRKYEVLDVGDSDEVAQQRKPSGRPRCYKLSKNKIRVLPSEPRLDLAEHARTLAVYPNTTVFYPATVHISAMTREDREYTLEFDDEEEQGDLRWKRVPAYHVLPMDEAFDTRAVLECDYGNNAPSTLV
eukprot:CAMPEP_0184753170 /NCGR_PEP_ID=MMETSP0315-20130426/43964_1 /TAXON_ID=101924 /ORGANISM="Rhodosorus marinus, Strain UTEX LB 2760" /LENGTH=298 /DNA_ID=CAMNT_0027232539 /DNA_START=336 /DNA_END=1233 /DNA_ORIENTATION=-